MTNIKSIKKLNHSWKGKIEINGTEYFGEQFTTSNPLIFKIMILTQSSASLLTRASKSFHQLLIQSNTSKTFLIILSSSNLTNIKSMKKLNHSWKGKIEINGTEYFWEQFTTSNPLIFKIMILTPVQIQFDFEPQKISIGQAISIALQLVT